MRTPAPSQTQIQDVPKRPTALTADLGAEVAVIVRGNSVREASFWLHGDAHSLCIEALGRRRRAKPQRRNPTSSGQSIQGLLRDPQGEEDVSSCQKNFVDHLYW